MIVFCWKGFPQYAARCIGAFVRQTSEAVAVIGTPPDIPIQGMETLVGCPVHWVNDTDTPDLQALVGEIPTHIFTSGWSVPAFAHMARTVRAHGGKAFSMVDSNYRLTLKECLRALRFRLRLRRRFDGYFVPGEGARQALTFYGADPKTIIPGVLSADATLFTNGAPLPQRPKKLIYVGRLCQRKNVRGLCQAFLDAHGPQHGWTLELYGCGEQKALLPHDHPAIQIHDFLQPEPLAEVYRTARCFILPSFEEPWGLVVHEATLSGCYLLLSERVGAAKDLLTPQNGITFDPTSPTALINALQHLFRLDDATLLQAQQASLTLAQKCSTAAFIHGVNTLCT